MPDSFRQLIEGNRFDHNGGAGLRLLSRTTGVRRNLAVGNGGNGIEVRAPGEGTLDSLLHNTSVFNRGDGIVWSGPEDASFIVENNLAAFNTGAGFAGDAPGAGVLHNDAWMNEGGDYAGVGPGAENLIADPLFCDATGEDFHLRSDSPCAPSGPYGLIGALDVGCGAPTATTVAWFEAVEVAGGVEIRWRLGDASARRAVVERSLSPRGPWSELKASVRERAGAFVVLDEGASGGDVRYRLRIETADGRTTIVGPIQASPAPPGSTLEMRIAGSHPAPGTVMIELAIPRPVSARVSVFDVLGRQVDRIAERNFNPGIHLLAWTPPARSGVFFVRVDSEAGRSTARAVVLH
jgi:hypothetical protein